MKRLMVALLAIVFVFSTAIAVKAACPAGCKKSCCVKTEGERKGGCEKADPNSK